jgi:signal transduction histidine kinase
VADWVGSQPPWSDFPFILLTRCGGGLERNPLAAREMQTLGNVSFLERPFHPTTLVSLAQTALRGRRRQYETRQQLEALHRSDSRARAAQTELGLLNQTLEARIAERTSELENANRELVAQIVERERVEATLRQMQRLEAVGQLTSGVAHDFNNLLTVVLGNISFLERDNSAFGNDEKVQQRLSHMRLAGERGAKLTAQLLAFARRQRLDPKPLDVNEALVNMQGLLRTTIGGGIVIDWDLHSGIWRAFADQTQIELVVLNLVINARDAMHDRGSITVQTANAKLGPPETPEEPSAGDYVMIAVSDTGSGMTKEVLAKAFEPFFTTKEVGKGSGLGLSQVLGFAKQSDGGLRIETRPQEGTSVRVYLPRAADDAAVSERGDPAAARNASRRGAVILAVDDDRQVREVTAAILEQYGYVVLQAAGGRAALDVLAHRTRVDLVLLDFAMPGMSGIEVAGEIESRFPEVPILFVTGYADKSAFGKVSQERIVRKPFVGDELVRKVDAALTRMPNLASEGTIVPLRR